MREEATRGSKQTYSFAKTPLKAAKAPEPMAQVTHRALGGFEEVGAGVLEVASGEEESRGSSGCSGGGVRIRSGMVAGVCEEIAVALVLRLQDEEDVESFCSMIRLMRMPN